MIDRIIHRLKTINPWHFLWITILLSEIFGLLFNAIQSYLWWGFLSFDLLLIGAIDCLLLPLLIAPIVIYFIFNASQLEKINKELQIEIIKEKQLSEQKRHESEALYRILFENAPVGIGIADVSGNLIAFNNAMLVPGGYTREDMAAIRNVSELYYTIEERDKALAVFRKQGFLQQFPVQFKRRDGTPYDTLLSLRPITYHGITCAQAMVEDITERKRIQEELEKNERRYRELFEDSPIALCEIDISAVKQYVASLQDAPTRDMTTYFKNHPEAVHRCAALITIVDMNNAMLELFGAKTKEELTENSARIFHEESFDLFREDIVAYMENRTRHDHESVAQTIAGDKIHVFLKWFSASGNHETQSRIIASFIDITDRKLAEEALRESEARLRKLSDNLPNGLVYQIDTGEDGRQRKFLYISAGVEQLHGITVKEVMNDAMSIYGQIIEEDRLRLEEEEAVALAHVVPFSTETRLRLPSGEIRWRHFASAPRRLLNNHMVWDGIEIDITERKHAEKSLLESREWFRKLVETMNEGLGIQDEKGVITYVNERFCQMVGYSSAELIGKPLAEFLDETNRKILKEHIAMRQKGNKAPYDLRWTRRNGEFIYTVISPQPLFDENGQYTGSFATLTDITDRKHLEKSLKESEDRFRITLHNSPIVVFTQDRSLRFTWIYNPRHGHTQEDVIGKTDADVCEVENPARLTAIKQRVIENGVSRNAEVGLRFAGETLYYDSYFEPLYDSGGAIIGLTGVAIDITERKKNENLIRAYQEQLRLLASRLILVEEAERRKIALELHDNIGQILAYAKLKLGEIRESCDGDFREAIGRIHSLIEQSIKYTRSLTSELCPPIAYEMGLEAAVEWLGLEVQKNHEIAFSLHDDNKSKPLHEEARIILFQSVRELLTNIVKHAQAHHITVSLGRKDHSIQIIVEDDGIGFDATPIHNGLYMTSGFGLFSISERLHNIGGRLAIQSAPGSATRVTLTAPLKA